MVKGEVVDKIYLDWWGGCKKRAWYVFVRVLKFGLGAMRLLPS